MRNEKLDNDNRIPHERDGRAQVASTVSPGAPLRIMRSGIKRPCAIFQGKIIDEHGTTLGRLIEITDVDPKENNQFAVMVRTEQGELVLRATAYGMSIIHDAVATNRPQRRYDIVPVYPPQPRRGWHNIMSKITPRRTAGVAVAIGSAIIGAILVNGLRSGPDE